MVVRLKKNPIISPDMLEGDDGANINGPSLIEVPSWVPNAMGRFYLYFAHHKGQYIRMAYSNSIEGPWSVYSKGTLGLGQCPQCRDHIASPDVHVDEIAKKIRMYFHGVHQQTGRQLTFIAESQDGLSFEVLPNPIANFYFRAVRWRDLWIGMSKGGHVYLSKDPLGPFKMLSKPAFSMSNALANASGDVRHVALSVECNTLNVFFSRIGDRPERILHGTIDLTKPLNKWVISKFKEILRPLEAWEGAHQPLEFSTSGQSPFPENALRDPAFFHLNGIKYLLYTVMGEMGIAIVRLDEI